MNETPTRDTNPRMNGTVDTELSDGHIGVLVLLAGSHGQTVDCPRAHGHQGGVWLQVLVPRVAGDNGVGAACGKIRNKRSMGELRITMDVSGTLCCLWEDGQQTLDGRAANNVKVTY